MRSADPDAVQALGRALAVPPLLATLLLHRGCRTAAEARRFLAAPLDALHDPRQMAGMEAATARLRAAIARHEAVRVCGDYDADGVSGAALLTAGLTALGAAVTTRIPHRLQDGYGLPLRFVDEAHADGVGLLVAVDAGIAAHEAAERARQFGLDLIICDHHHPPDPLPPALAILNPRQPGCPYPCKELCGAGIAFKLLQALHGPDEPGRALAWMDLAAIATIADVVPLLGENRILVRHGLPQIRASARPGLRALAEVAGLDLDGRDLTPGQVAFVLAPRLNAAGRMDEAALAVRLLLAEDPVEARALAERLDAANRRRQAVEGAVLEEAVGLVDASRAAGRADGAIVLASPAWHPGVLGIVASRLVERYGVPAALVAILGEEARGSIRSPAGWHVAEGLARCADLLAHFGGHATAGGFSLLPGRIEAFRERLATLVAEQGARLDGAAALTADAEVDFTSLDLGLADALARLHPHGAGNPEPLLIARKVQVMRSPRRVGKNHLKMRVRQTDGDGRVLDSIGFNLGDLVEVLDGPEAPRVDLAFTPERNVWNGREMLQLRVRGVQVPSGTGLHSAGLGPERIGSARPGLFPSSKS